MAASKTIISAQVELNIFAVYESSFTSKEGKKVPYYKAIVNAFPGSKELSITKDLFDELSEVGSGFYTVLFCYDYKFQKVKLDSIG